MGLLDQDIINIMIGISAMIGAILLVAAVVLNKVFGLIHFGKKREVNNELKTCPAHKEMIEGHKDLEKNQKELEKELKIVSQNQIKNMEKHKQHQQSFQAGEKIMKKLSCDIKNLSIGVAVLLDRSANAKIMPNTLEGFDVKTLIKALTTHQVEE